jgi:hypothetical protein
MMYGSLDDDLVVLGEALCQVLVESGLLLLEDW